MNIKKIIIEVSSAATWLDWELDKSVKEDIEDIDMSKIEYQIPSNVNDPECDESVIITITDAITAAKYLDWAFTWTLVDLCEVTSTDEELRFVLLI